jgi:hypothetical protein
MLGRDVDERDRLEVVLVELEGSLGALAARVLRDAGEVADGEDAHLLRRRQPVEREHQLAALEILEVRLGPGRRVRESRRLRRIDARRGQSPPVAHLELHGNRDHRGRAFHHDARNHLGTAPCECRDDRDQLDVAHGEPP